MVILVFTDGQAERHSDAVLSTLFAETKPVQEINLLDPEEVELLEMQGVSLEVGYGDPRKEAN